MIQAMLWWFAQLQCSYEDDGHAKCGLTYYIVLHKYVCFGSNIQVMNTSQCMHLNLETHQHREIVGT